jgi:transposase
MKPEEYSETYKSVNRLTALMAYEPTVLKWLETYPCMTAAQVRDWLEERYQLDTSDRTIRRLVTKLREEHGITRKSEPKREYEAVDELPKGYQLQLDFGEKSVRYSYGGRYIKLYFAVFSLSYSRYKWGIFQDRPFLSTDLVRALYGCFEYFGGTPRQLVYDQDSIIVVSENGGDIVHTQVFATFLAETKLEVRVCRKSDPQSKGLIEASVKFIKRNFMENRYYMDLDTWNRSFEDWLIRTGNGQRHGTTKRKPSEMFAEEQEYLLPLYGSPPAEIADDMRRTIRPDNTVWYLSNRYTVPLGTYGKEKDVFLDVAGDKLHIMDIIGDCIATHQISTEKGKLIKLKEHRRDKKARVIILRDEAIALLGEEFRSYLTILCEEKRRYVKDQLEIIKTTCKTYGRENVLSAMSYCQERTLYSANDLRDAVEAMCGALTQQSHQSQIPVEDERYHINVQKRDLTVYAEVASGSVVTQ